MDYSNLRLKTPMNFTSDKGILDEILPYIPKDAERETFIAAYYAEYPAMLACALLELADATNNAELRQQTQKQFKKELAEYFNE